MKPLPKSLIATPLLTLALAAPNYAEDFIRVGSLNIANFGASPKIALERTLVSLVNIIRQMDADLIAIQEVEPTDLGSDQLLRLRELLNKAAEFDSKKPYDYIVASEHTGGETTAFLWRDPVDLESEIVLLEHEADPDGDGKPTFRRVPHYALFSAGKYDFYVVNCHLYTLIEGVSAEGRGEEFDAIVDWLKELATEQEKDAIVLGDFNRFLNGKSAWKRLMIAGHKTWFRFPLLEAIKKDNPSFDPAKDHAPTDDYSTTTSKSKSIYDQILISRGSDHEFTSDPKFGEDVGLIAFDQEEQFKWVTDSWHDAIRMLTDHRPVWIRLRTDKSDDDGED